MQLIAKRVKTETYEFGRMYQVESKYVKSGYFKTEQEARNDHNEKLKIYRQMIKEV